MTDSKLQKFFTVEKLSKLRHEIYEHPQPSVGDPHNPRRALILEKYPEVKQLMKPNPWIAVRILVVAAVQLYLASIAGNYSWKTMALVAYFIGGTTHHLLENYIHDLIHNGVFGHRYPRANIGLGIICNLPIVAPLFITFRKFHLHHHRHLGDGKLDPEIPFKWEVAVFRFRVMRVIYLFIQVLFHSFRPQFKGLNLPEGKLGVFNWVACVAFDALIYVYVGPAALGYMAASTILAFIHPTSAGYVSEHYFEKTNQATYSYYGWGNYLTSNRGYHVEHHDFPSIPSTELPKLHKICPEFYDTLSSHPSLCRVMWNLVMDPDMGPQAKMVTYKYPEGAEAQEMNGIARANGTTPNGNANGSANGHAIGHHGDGSSSNHGKAE